MAVYNGDRYLHAAIRSILDQTLRDLEYIIIDDSSTDRSGEILARFAQRDERIHVVTQSNQGHAESLNRGWRLARGRYIARMDADDVALPHRLERQAGFLDLYPAVAVVGGAAQVINANGTVLFTEICPLKDHQIRKTLADSSPFYHSATMIRTDAMKTVNGYRPVFEDAEDYDLWLRLSELFELANLPETVIQHRIHEDQVSHRTPRRQYLAHVAAHIGARLRQQGKADPFWQIKELTPELLGELGVSRESLERGYIERVLSRADQFSGADGCEKALRFLEEELMTVRNLPISRSLRGDIYRRQGSIHRRQGRWLRSLAAYSQACRLDPGLIARELLSRCSSVVPSSRRRRQGHV